MGIAEAVIPQDIDVYRTDLNSERSSISRTFLNNKFTFYPQVFRIIWKNSRRALKDRYTADNWAESSFEIFRTLENIGVIIEISGMSNLRKFIGPAVFIGNHMSTLETLVLPAIIQPVKSVTFVVKKSLVSMPVFGPIMRSRDPIVVGRTNAREDLRAVLEGGVRKLKEGLSIIIFPQSTRSVEFDPRDFNSLGIKLALKANVPVVPLALKTDAWGIGKPIKDFGRIDTQKKVYFAFGAPISVKGRGMDEHRQVINFITDHLYKWSNEIREVR